MAAVFAWLYVNSDKEKLKAQWLKTIGWLWGAILTCVMAVVLILGFLHDHDFEISITRFSPIKVQYTQAPNNMLFRGGFLRRALVCYDDFIQKNLELDESQKAEIKREYTDYKERSTTVPTVKGEKNLIFIIVPTSPTFWEQDKMNSLYGIEEMYSKFNCNEAMHSNEDLNDEQVFTMALQAETTTAQPFFSLIVTMSMHNPYNKFVEHGFEIADKQYSEEYLNYLIDCHYTDAQIERYINALKQHGLYDNSVIVITSDHQALPVHLNMDEKEVSDELPLFIINGGIDKNKFWTGPCNQLDVYTTLLDIYGVRSEWRGLGHTLLNVKCKEYPIEKMKLLSDWIIRSNYFGLSQ